MKQLMVVLLLTVLFCPGLPAGAGEGAELLRRSDEAFFPKEARFLFRLEEYENNEYRRYHLMEGYIKGEDRYLLIGLEPAVNRGMVQLRVQDVIHVYLKRIDKMDQVSAKVAFQNTLLSQEDVMNTKLANFYDLESYEKTVKNGRKIYVLHLTARSREVAYYRIISYIDAESYLPVKREYFAFSGQKIKELIVDKIEFHEGRLSCLAFTIYDILRPGYFARVMFSDFDYSRALEDRMFTRTYMRAAAR